MKFQIKNRWSGAVMFEAHHDDYSQPLTVRWLCHTHHREHHAKAKVTP